jgi:hypothetical protein
LQLRDPIEDKRRKFVRLDILRDLRSKRQAQPDSSIRKIGGDAVAHLVAPKPQEAT